MARIASCAAAAIRHSSRRRAKMNQVGIVGEKRRDVATKGEVSERELFDMGLSLLASVFFITGHKVQNRSKLFMEQDRWESCNDCSKLTRVQEEKNWRKPNRKNRARTIGCGCISKRSNLGRHFR